MMTRRGMLSSLAGLGAMAGAFAWRFHRSDVAAAIATVVRTRLAYLDLDQAGVEQFARDLAARNDISALKLRALGVAGPLYRWASGTNGRNWLDALRVSEERIVTIFLLSSDFFTHGADEHRTVRYLALYDAMHACSNPFARPVEPQTAPVA